MSKFDQQFKEVLQKKLQRVSLKIDPLLKHSEDFELAAGYEGYILAETPDSYRIFASSSSKPSKIIMLSKSEYIIEKGFVRNALKAAAHTVAPSISNMAGVSSPRSGASYKAGNSIANIVKMALGQQPTQPATEEPTVPTTSNRRPLPDSIIRGKTYTVYHDPLNGACVNFDGNIYKIRTIISLSDRSIRLYPEQFNYNLHTLLEINALPPQNVLYPNSSNIRRSRPQRSRRKVSILKILSTNIFFTGPVSITFVGPDNKFYYNKAQFSSSGSTSTCYISII